MITEKESNSVQATETVNKPNAKSKNRVIKAEEAIGNTLNFWEKHSKIIFMAVAVVVVAVVCFFLIKKFYIEPRNERAADEIYAAQYYFERNDMEKALNGDGKHLGFLQVIDEFGSTRSGNLANYYVGVIYLNQGKYSEAIDYFKDFSSNDMFLDAQAQALTGDAYWELKDINSAIEYYEKAVRNNPNEMTTPFTLLKLGIAYESKEDYTKALEVYKRIKNEFPRTGEAREIDKYISRMEALR